MFSNRDVNLGLFEFIESYASAFTKFIRIYSVCEKENHRTLVMENTWAGHVLKRDINKTIIPPIEASYFAKMNDTDDEYKNDCENEDLIHGIFAKLDISVKAIFDVSKISSATMLGGFDDNEVIGVMPSIVVDPYDGATIPVLDIFIE